MGEIFALLAALTWAVAVVLFRRSEAVDAQGINLFKNVLAVILLAITLPLVGDTIDLHRTQEDWARLIISGVLGVAVADTMMFMALRRLGASLLATVDTAYAPTIVLFSILVLDEPLTAGLFGGGLLVVVGVVIATSDKKPTIPNADRRTIRTGIIVGIGGIVLMALGVVIVKPVLEQGSLVEVTLIRLVAGVIAQLLWMLVVPSGRTALRALRPSKTWLTLLPGSFLGTYVAMLFWLGGFKWADASVAAVLNQMSAVFIILLSWVFLREHVSRRRAVGALLAVLGACLVLAV